jgi:predicted NUDIX family NTP pyrophosphohydrolase
MAKVSAGIIPYRSTDRGLEVLLVHPGGPFWARRDLGSWSIAKGLCEPGEAPFDAALREFVEETGHTPRGDFLPLGSHRQPGGKLVHAWAVALDWDPALLECNTFEMEWPRGSGRLQRFPEVDRAGWFDVREAVRRILPGQRPFIEELHQRLVGARLSGEDRPAGPRPP